FERQVRRRQHRAGFIREYVGREGGLTEETRVDRRTALTQRSTAVGSAASEIPGQHLVAIAVGILPTTGTFAAEVRAQDHRIAGREPRYSRTDALDNSRALVPEHYRL